MPVYVGLFNFTESGLKSIRDSPARTREVAHWLEDHGFEIHSMFFTMGQYDFVCIIEDAGRIIPDSSGPSAQSARACFAQQQ